MRTSASSGLARPPPPSLVPAALARCAGGPRPHGAHPWAVRKVGLVRPSEPRPPENLARLSHGEAIHRHPPSSPGGSVRDLLSLSCPCKRRSALRFDDVPPG